MNRNVVLESLLFWLMLLLGLAALVPCLLLPPWLEYQAQLDRRAAANRALEAQRARLAAAEKQIDHIENDPAYVLRLAEQELGPREDLPHDPPIPVGPRPRPTTAEAAPGTGLPEVSAFVDQLLAKYPQSRFFIDARTRPVLMVMGSGLILMAILLLGKPGRGATGRPGGPAQEPRP